MDLPGAEVEQQMNKSSILVVDDDRVTQELLREVLCEAGHEVVTLGSAEEALEVSKKQVFDVILSDMKLGSSLSGLDVLRAYKSIQPDTEVILITAFGSMQTAIEAVKAGAFDYLSKPFRLDEVRLRVERALGNRRLTRESRAVRPKDSGPTPLESLVGRSPAMLEIYKKIAMVSDSRSTVLICGESGTGKELVARAIHSNGPRAKQRFMAINFGALTETLLETELFGHVKGSFTGAIENKRGILEEATGGTVFLDEVTEMSPALQVKLLRALEEQRIRRIGSNQDVEIDVRVIAAGNRNLGELVEQEKFREDLYYRLRVIEIDLPPLRERTADIPLLAEHFLKKLGSKGNRVVSLSPEALAVLSKYSWPGNVRELENVLEAVVSFNRTGTVTAEELPEKLRGSLSKTVTQETLYSDLPSLDELADRYLNHVLEVTRGNKARAANIMGINRKTLYRMQDRSRKVRSQARRKVTPPAK